MSGTQAGNARGAGYHAKRAACVDATGLSPSALKVLLAVMSYERVYGVMPQSSDVREFLDMHDLQLRELTNGLWLELVERNSASVGKSKHLTARSRAWKSLGFSKAVTA